MYFISCAFTAFAAENDDIECNYADEDLFIEYCIETITYAYVESETLETIIILDTFQKNDVIKRTLNIKAEVSGTITITV